MSLFTMLPIPLRYVNSICYAIQPARGVDPHPMLRPVGVGVDGPVRPGGVVGPAGVGPVGPGRR